jgi:hypothetical protein
VSSRLFGFGRSRWLVARHIESVEVRFDKHTDNKNDAFTAEVRVTTISGKVHIQSFSKRQFDDPLQEAVNLATDLITKELNQ